MQAYTDILVAPVQALFAAFHGGPVHPAGPLYPDIDRQGRARHWRGTAPVDVCPQPPAEGDTVDRLGRWLRWSGQLPGRNKLRPVAGGWF